MHHGIMGMKWGVRRYQNADGSLTPAGRRRYLKFANSDIKEKKTRLTNLIRSNAEWTKGKSGQQQKALASKLEKAATISDRELKNYENLAKKYASDQGKNYVTLKDLNAAIKGGHAGVKVADKLINIYGELVIEQSPSQKSTVSKKTNQNAASSRESRIQKFVNTNKSSGSQNSLKDIDDLDLIDLYIDDPAFRKEYGVSDSEYKRYKREVG